MYVYRICRLDAPHRLLGTTPCRELLNSRSTARLPSPPRDEGMVLDMEFPLTSRYVSEVRRPRDVGNVPCRPTDPMFTVVIKPDTHVTPAQCDSEPEHTLPAVGTDPEHFQFDSWDSFTAPNAAAKSHIMESSKVVGVGS